MPSILDKIRGKSKRKSQSSTNDGGYSSGAGSESDGGRQSGSFEHARPLTRDYGRGSGSGMVEAGGGTGERNGSNMKAGGGYEALPNGSSVVINHPQAPLVPHKEKDLSRKPSPIDKDDIPPRSTSLNPTAAVPVDGAAGGSSGTGGLGESMSKLAIQEHYTGESQQFHRRSLESPPTAHSTAIPQQSLPSQNGREPPHESRHRDTVEEHHRHPDRASPEDLLDMGKDFKEPEKIIAARQEMAERIAAEAREQYKPVDEDKRGVFEQAGLGENLDNRGEVEVRTEWLKPVVHETIRPVVHTETTEVVTIDRHIHHIYPKIQPIHDPDPIRLPPRHRIFNPTTSSWHEVIGDEAAISILGSAVFYNGWREYREYRAPALPGLTDDGEVLVFSEMRGSREPQFEARQIEREGERGNMSGWRALKGRLDVKGVGGDDARMIGEVDDSVGVKTMGIKI